MPFAAEEELSTILTLDLYLLLGMALTVILAGLLFWPSRHRPNQKLPYLAVAVICLGAFVVPASWRWSVQRWEGLTEIQRADILVIIHFSITAVAVVLQGLFLLGGVLNWGWVRNFWLRLFHLVAIVVVAGQAVNH